MGDEIPSSHFSSKDLKIFTDRLRVETQLVSDWIAQDRFSFEQKMFGYELEAWLIDRNFRPAPINEQFLQALDDPLVVPELASFNFELNSSPQRLTDKVFTDMKQGLSQICNRCRHHAQLLDADMLMIGILPTVRETDLSLEHMSNSPRYRALNEQVFRLRQGRPIQIDIKGQEHLTTRHDDVMLEAATTSFQLHLQIPADLAVRYYNAAIILSGPMVAATGNSPYLFGKHLWEETRIPLFEQAVSIGGHKHSEAGDLKRVSFGTGYAKNSLLECFLENRDHYPVILPVLFDEPPEALAHLRLHNGTIWRWNRPLIGFNAEGEPHLRIEHRVVSAGPSIIDTVANAALFVGVIKSLVDEAIPQEQILSFSVARHNFYAAAHLGLQARFHWFNGNYLDAGEYILKYMLPLAHTGLERLDINKDDIQRYLGIIEQRIITGQTGANWQQRYAAAHDDDMGALAAAYAMQQQQGKPVHEWPI
ncbi:MAG: glutamate--cysteine ligase [Nitrosomonas sp.]|nr:glutamate--cysteine ligase [Nitrosomonas sp.]MDP1951210.1 glutamate--cysteine ligase [Nitrosomonas sp.]